MPKQSTTAALEQKARRMARVHDCYIRKSRRGLSLDNLGGFAILDPHTNIIVAGSRYELSAQDVIAYFA